MAPRRVINRLLRTFLPIVGIILVAVASVSAWIVYSTTRPPRAKYLITPQTFPSGPIARASDVTWPNHDGTQARGWLIKGDDGAPAVILLHRYGADRSWLLNMAVKLNESTGFTVLWPDLRGHGEKPPVNWSLFGAIEGDDVTAAIDYLHTLKTTEGKPQTGLMGVYGVELGAYAALDAAKRYPEVRALAVDSVPASPDEVMRAATGKQIGMSNSFFQILGRWGMKVYSAGKYQNTPACELARALHNEKVLLLSGTANDTWRGSTLELAGCFVGGNVETKKDLPITGGGLDAATGEQEEAYDRPIIEFFKTTLK
ncbi:MAG TPA: alpha/beta hydrolase [Pyrinomonadaceae bacterium]|nr:alpha/beta hydrolase [Pyrinomonadaceae bacterium]